MMKKSFLLCAAACICALTSCKSTKETVTISELDGEWNIVEINGAAVVLSGAIGDYPYLHFDSSTGKLSGNSGCNRIMGSYETQGKAGKTEFGNIAGTRMACPEMTLEGNVLNALKNVKGYKKVNSGKNIALLNSRNRPLLLLAPREGEALIYSLQGRWNITQVNEQAVPGKMEKQPFINIDVKANRISGTAGCNVFNGSFITENDKPRSIAFPATATTMMVCPDMDVESKILKAVNSVKSFNILSENKAVLLSEEGAQLLLLEKE